MQPPSFFERIQRRSSERWDQLENDPELAGPWHQLFRQVQSPRHVVSELLQNADDAGAKSAFIRIEKSTFIFEHDGVDFDDDHLASLCRFGFSNKRTLHTIGFRGVGFKSTFSLGDTVEVRTPTLAFCFQNKRFTEPKWLPDVELKQWTSIRVPIADQDRETQLRKNFEEWAQSPSSLLFFNSLKELTIEGQTIKSEALGDGPLVDSNWVKLGDAGSRKLLVIKSKPVEFPEEAAKEICAERGIALEDLHLPPCRVEIVLGSRENKRLYVVLPTGAELSLPFSCNAPFIQDPARFAIKDPATSPTNRWLLERAGTLAGKSMIAWLGNKNLSMDERSEAYQLLKAASQYPSGLNGTCSQVIMKAMSSELASQPILLTTDRKVAEAGEGAAVPAELFSVWDAKQVRTIFAPESKHLLASEVPVSARNALDSYGWLKIVDLEKALQRFEGGENIPRPPWPQLHALWSFVEAELRNRDWNNERRRRMKIVPVDGSKILYPANSVVRLSSKRDLLPRNEDWKFIMDHAPTMDADWLAWISKRAPKKGATGSEQSDTGYRLLQALSLHEPSPVDRIATLASLRIFTGQEPSVADCVQIAHIMAALSASIPSGFRYVTKNLYLRDCSHGIITDENGRVEDLAPVSWTNEHLLHEAYSRNFTSCSAQVWKLWNRTPGSGLLHFVAIIEWNRALHSRESVTRFVTERGATEPKQFHYRRDDFTVEDYGFPPELVKHWELIAKSDDAVWAGVLDGILTGPVHSWKNKTEAKILHKGTTYSQSLDCGFIPADWIIRLRSLPCLPDNHGKLHLPAELLVRTPDTEPLIGVEPFVRAELDTESNRRLLKLLNVRDKPVDADKLLKRLHALSGMKNPFSHLMQISRLYEALDRIVVRCAPAELKPVVEAFSHRAIILTEAGEWMTSGEVSIFTDEDNNAPCVHSSLRTLSLWLRIGVSERPALERTIEWLNTLASGVKLDASAAKRVRSVLQRDPVRIWNECQHWLTLDSTWERTDSLKYRITMQSLTKWGELFSAIKRTIASLQMLTVDVAQLPPFSLIANLVDVVEFRVSKLVESPSKRESRKWLVELSQGLSRVKLSNDDDTCRVRSAAQRLRKTIWHTFDHLEVTPCLEGVPAGEHFKPNALWQGLDFYVADQSTVKLYKELVDELARPFSHSQASDAIAACIDRTPNFVAEYLEAHFILAMHPEIQTTQPSTPSVDSKSGKQVEQDQNAPTITEVEIAGKTEQVPPVVTQDEPVEKTQSELITTKTETPKLPHPAKPTLIEYYAKQRGFRWHPNEKRFTHTNGSWIEKSESPFNWEEHASEGDLVTSIWVTDQKLANGVELAAELWALFSQHPAVTKLLVAGEDHSPYALTGQELLQLKDSGQITLHPARYRIVENREHL